MKYDIIILNGGYGSRVNKYSKKKPKCLITFNNKPFIYYQIINLKKLKFTNIIISTFYKSGMIRKYLKNNFSNLNLKIVKEPKKLGTAGAIKYCLKYLRNNFFILYGDSYLDFNYKKLKVRKTKKIKMAIYKNNNKLDKSNIKFNKLKNIIYSNNSINSKYIDYGVSYVSKSIFKNIKTGEVKELSDLYHEISNKSGIEGYIVKNRFYEIGSYSGIRDFKKFLKKKYEIYK